MKDKIELSTSQMAGLNEILPTTGRAIFREAIKTSLNILLESGVMETLVEALRSGEEANRQTRIEEHFIENFVWPAMLKDQLSQYGKEKLENFAEYIKSSGLPNSITSLDPNQLNKGYFDTISNETELLFDGVLPEALGKDIAVPLAGLLFIQVGMIRFKEDKILRNNPTISHADLSASLDEDIEGVIKLHTELASIKIYQGLVSEKYEKYSAKSKGGKNSKRNKDAIFDDFIDWAFELPKSETDKFSFPVSAARYYIENHLSERCPGLTVHVSDTTARTACEKLKNYCNVKNLKNPLLKQ
ncbi:MAG: hypothetical protein ACI87Q_002749 [Pseudohongiellaceae bacterium]|jgi:hypothetical protein